MINLVLGSKLLSQVKTAFRINSAHENGRVDFKINNMSKTGPSQSAITCSKLTIETRTRCEICSKLTIKTTDRRQLSRSGVVTVNFEHILHFVLVFLLLTLNK